MPKFSFNPVPEDTIVYENHTSEYIVISKDKLENILMKHESRLASSQKWLTPFSIFLTVLITFLTADFKLAFSVKSSTWEAIFIILGVISFFWLVVELMSLSQVKGKVSIDYLVGIIIKKQDK